MRRLAATAVALLALLAASCVDGDGPTPPGEDATPSPTPTATEAADRVATATPTPTSTPMPPAAASPIRTPAPTPTVTPTPAAVPTPEPPPVTVQGPLLVLSERVGDAPPRRGDEIETRRVYIYDLAEDRYWAAFDYENPRTRIGVAGEESRSAVQPAGTSIVVWSGEQVRRMGLDGVTQAVLFEDDTIRAIRVSPDGAKVAVMHGEPGTLLVLDARDGAEVLQVASGDPNLGTLRYGGRDGMLNLGDWRADSEAVSVTGGDYSGPRAHTAVLWLDGNIRVLGEGLIVSPDLRYAIQVGRQIAGWPKNHQPYWDRLTVLDVETGDVVWTIAEEQGLQLSLYYGPWFGRYVTLDYNATRLLDTETGEIAPRTPGLERQVEGAVISTCGLSDSYGSSACYVQHAERVVWEGEFEWTHYLGMVEVPGSIELRGIDPLPVTREIAPPPPPGRDEMVGPLLAYEVHGEYEYRHGEGRPEPRATRRMIIHDEGTGRSWLAFTYQNPLAHWGYSPGAAQPALGGFVAEIEQRLIYYALDGQSRTLHERWPEAFRVSPDGRRLAVSHYADSDGTVRVPSDVIVLNLPTGDRALRLTSDEIVAAEGLDPDAAWSVSLPGAGAWTADSAHIVVGMLDWRDEYHEPAESLVVVTLDGAARSLPCDRPACLSPDARYIVRGRDGAGREYGPYSWRSFDIIDFETDRVLWTTGTPNLLAHYHWEWASATHFAWSSGGSGGAFIFDGYRLPRGATRAEVSVLDVTTGEVEVMDSAEYLARFHPPSRATTECPPHPAQPCRILLDGEVIGEGRWPRIIGFIELD